MFTETANTPSEICAAVEGGARKAKVPSQPIGKPPSATPYPETAVYIPQTIPSAPFSGTNPRHHEAIDAILEVYRLRQDMIRARTKLILQAQASLRRVFDGDREKAAKAFAEVKKDPGHDLRGQIQPYLASLEVLDEQQAAYEKELVRDVKKLPIYEWAKSIKGFGDLSLACIIGEASGYRNDDGTFYSVGDFKSVSALWKRMGLAVLYGKRQGIVGKDVAGPERKARFIEHGYSPTKRSTMWNIGNSLILGMGKFRPVYGENIDANENYTYYQKVFANRARYEALNSCPKMVETKKGSGKFVPKLDSDGNIIRIELNEKTGKESYSAHAANRAKRYVEKRLLRDLYAEWRRCMA